MELTELGQVFTSEEVVKDVVVPFSLFWRGHSTFLKEVVIGLSALDLSSFLAEDQLYVLSKPRTVVISLCL
jgi:hypothetical protein